MPDSLSVLHFVRRIRAEDGGVVQTVLDLCQTVASRGHRVTLATFDATDVPPQWSHGGQNLPTVAKLEPSTWFQARLSPASLEAFHGLMAQADLAHLHTPWEPANVQLASLLSAARVPYIVTIHGMLDEWSMQQRALKKRAYLALFGRRLFQHATTVHFTAAAERDQAARWIPGDYLPAIQACAMDLSPFDKLPGPEPAMKAFPCVSPEKKTLLFLSRVHPKKGVELLLEAARILHDCDHGVQVLVAGPGEDDYLNQLQTLSRRLSLTDDVHFLGMVRGVEKVSLYQLADVFVLPTYQENFGIVLAEALASGTPVVTTRGTDIWRELQEAGAEIVHHAPSEIAGAVRRLLSDDNRRREIGQQGRDYVMQWLSSENVAAGYERMYRDTLQRHLERFHEQVPN